MTTAFTCTATLLIFSALLKIASNGTEGGKAVLIDRRKQLRKSSRQNSVRKGLGVAAAEGGMKQDTSLQNTEQRQPCMHTRRGGAKEKTCPCTRIWRVSLQTAAATLQKNIRQQESGATDWRYPAFMVLFPGAWHERTIEFYKLQNHIKACISLILVFSLLHPGN